MIKATQLLLSARWHLEFTLNPDNTVTVHNLYRADREDIEPIGWCKKEDDKRTVTHIAYSSVTNMQNHPARPIWLAVANPKHVFQYEQDLLK